MKKIIVALFILIYPLFCFSQIDKSFCDDEAEYAPEPFFYVEKMPVFLRGIDSLLNYLREKHNANNLNPLRKTKIILFMFGLL